MAYKRMLWRSGLIYERTCEQCKTTFRYMDDRLEFRPWYADGFVYCPKCKVPLRHSETLAVTSADGHPLPQVVAAESTAPAVTTPAPVSQEVAEPAKFCSDCGAPYREGDRFCSQCGGKRQ